MSKNKLLLLLALLLTAVTDAWAQTGMINGLFSVSATKRVYFSKGNLQYDGTNWKFAASQWEVLGANGTGATGTATNYPMDLFTWGNIDSPTYNGTTYYTENADLSGITDWGSRMGSGWRTLSKDEWLYLFGMESNNTDKSGHARYRKYFRATVNGVTGIVVLPDDLSGISDIPAESSRGTASAFSGKTYTTDAWSAMESAGCVFLPAAGFRNGTSVSNVGLSGWYWPSTAYDAGKAYTMGFDKDNVFPANNIDRNFGFSVRLVIDGYVLTLADNTKDAGKWTATVGTNSTANPLPVTGLNEGDAVTLKYTGRLKVKGVKVTSGAAPAEEPVTLATPLTIEAITAGTIQVNTNGTLSTGMKYSVNGGTKTPITSTTTIEGLKAGDKVQFYSNGTGNTVNSYDPEVKISGGTAEVKVYGNIMSLLNEEGFATKTDLQNYAFLGLFLENTTLIDASELLLPAATLAAGCYQQMFQGCTALTKAPKLPATTLKTGCYYGMFQGCSALTAAPALPATWLAYSCYAQMFSGCTSLTSAYVKAAYKNESDECYKMFDGCTATGAVLHTTSGNKASWEGVMGTGKTWPNWTVAGDWQE